MTTVEVRPLTAEDERLYRAIDGQGVVPVFVGECAGIRAWGNHLDEVLAAIRQGLAHRAVAMSGGAGAA